MPTREMRAVAAACTGPATATTTHGPATAAEHAGLLRARRGAPLSFARMRSRIAAVTCAVAVVAALSACAVPSGTSLGQRAVSVATAQIGKPYVYGASGPGSFDCSGLTGYVYAQLGVPLPRTTNDQYYATARVPQSAAQPGDLIFLGSPGSIYHMGIYVGGGQMIDAPKPGTAVTRRAIWTSNYHVGRVR